MVLKYLTAPVSRRKEFSKRTAEASTAGPRAPSRFSEGYRGRVRLTQHCTHRENAGTVVAVPIAGLRHREPGPLDRSLGIGDRGRVRAVPGEDARSARIGETRAPSPRSQSPAFPI